MTKFVDVLLPLPFNKGFTYFLKAEDEERVRWGCRVVVPFGKSKSYTGIVINIHSKSDTDYKLKEVIAILDESSIILPRQYEFWRWIADYYLCNIGDVLKAALPSGLKVESETIVELNENYLPDSSFSPVEQKILDLLGKEKNISIIQLQKDSGIKNLLPTVKSLIECGAVFISEQLRSAYKPKNELRVRFKDTVDEARLKEIFNLLARAPKQLALLMKYVELSGVMNRTAVSPVSKSDLLHAANATSSALKELVDKNIFEIYFEEVGRLNATVEATSDVFELNDYQQQAYKEIKDSYKEKNVCLLHGVTSSGKTEIYIHLIEDEINKGKQVLYLLPEIALTTQITHRLKRIFGSRLGIYHSKFPDNERVEIWKKQLSGQPYDIILGVRSSIFLPFQHLGLVIVDEEHETTYKQQDPAPRYHARNAAIVLASLYDAKTLLGTATPSIESWYNTQTEKYALVSLEHRYRDIKLPQILPIDMKDKRKRKQVNGLFSFELIDHIRQALDRNEQVILFQNRRGFAPMLMCHTCGWVPKCKNCDVSLTYHRKLNQLTCHYCGYAVQVPKICPACESTELLNYGFGTEKIEDEVQQLFPATHVARMDLDTTRSRNAYEKIIADFEGGKINVLIGTQIISKGLDFDNVSVVGILDADSILNYPDFRSYERAFQLMSQVAGRSGRKGKQGLVVIQTRDIKHSIIKQVIDYDYKGMAQAQLSERQQFNYPPFCHLIYIYVKHRDERQVELLANAMAIKLKKVFGERIIGPDLPPVGRIQSLYIRRIVLKIELSASLSKAREILQHAKEEVTNDSNFKSFIIYYDVDPM